ncbi:glycosyltransferase family 2 protein [Pedobacter heparinus]|uniref:glycosyltransferase family 2 protein n=1 Tax=Pedobacter heparinus TaxID=984 RepID=UPI00292CCCE7|nr:glycosyltransferase family 2 protein [Pedobacter heparinus]
MKVAGFTFIRNAILNDYPIAEAIESILPICDEFVVAVGKSEDETLQLIKDIGSAKIRIVETTWDHSLKAGGRVFAEETNKAYQAISADVEWAIYIQGDECIHEKYLPVIKKEMEATLDDVMIDALLLKYKHFYGAYDFVAESRRWYRREIRVLKRLPGISSYKDAQGFRINGRKLKVKLIDAYVYHYGWVKPPKSLNLKMNNFKRFYNDGQFVQQEESVAEDFDYGNADKVLHFNESPPAVMKARISKANWKFKFDPTTQQINRNLKRKLLQWIENMTGLRLFEYKNYKIVKRG